MNEGLRNLVRSEWFAQFRWIAGLSTFLIGITLTILTIMGDSIVWYNYIILFLTIGVLLTNVILVKRLIKDGISYYNLMAHGSTAESDIEEFYEMRDKKIPRLESWIKKTFWLGLGLFILFVLGYIITKDILNTFLQSILACLRIY